MECFNTIRQCQKYHNTFFAPPNFCCIVFIPSTVPRETENNAYAAFNLEEQTKRTMVFLIVANYFPNWGLIDLQLASVS